MGKSAATRQRFALPRGGIAAIAVIAFAFSAALPALAAPIVTLTECVDQALANGPGIRISRTNVALAQAQYVQAASANAFGVTGNAAATHSAAPNRGLPVAGQPLSAQDTGQAGVSLTAPLSTSLGVSVAHTYVESTYDQITQFTVSLNTTLWDGYPGGSARASVQKSGLTLQGTQATESANQKNVIYQVKQAYYSMLAQQRQQALYQETVAQRREELKRIQSLLDANSANRIDLQQAQVNQAQADLDLRLAQGMIEVNREKLSALIGWPLDKEYSVAEVDGLPAPVLDIALAVKIALSQRFDYRQILLSQASADIDLALKRGMATPTVTASSGLTYAQDWMTAPDPNTLPLSWSASLKVAGPLYDAGAVDAQIRQAALQKESATIQQGQLAVSIATDVKNAIYSLRDLRGRAELAQASQDLAQSQYDLTLLQLDTGASSNLDLLTSSVALTTAKVNSAKAHSDAQLGALALQNAMGY